MASKRPRSGKTRSLHTTITGVEPGHVPKKWVKFVAGAFLLFPCWVLTLAFCGAFLDSAGHSHFWSNWEFLGFAAGAALGVVFYFTVKPLVWLYVIGHELTHAIKRFLCRGLDVLAPS